MSVLNQRERSGKKQLSLVIITWGVQVIVTQSILLREVTVLVFGSELAWGMVLFSWLLGVSVGASIAGAFAERMSRAEIWLTVVLIFLTATSCTVLWLIRDARGWLEVGPGVLMTIGQTVEVALVCVTPVGLLVGMAFPCACCVGRTARKHPCPPGDGPLLSFGKVYALESAGSLIGGALFSFWAVEHLLPGQTILLCGAISIAACGGLATRRNQSWKVATPIFGLAIAQLATALLCGEVIDATLVKKRWASIAPGYRLEGTVESRYQNLSVGSRAGQYSLYCNGKVSTDFPDPYNFAPLAHFWLCQHPEPHNLLLVGGGCEGLLSEILCHPIAHVDYVEPDQQQIDLIAPLLAGEDQLALADPRVTVHNCDARHFIKRQRNKFDLVIACLPEPTSACRARFHTLEFYRELRRAMTDRSVFCTTVAASPGELSEESLEYLAGVRATISASFPSVIITWEDPAHVLAATVNGLVCTDPGGLVSRYEARSVASKMFTPIWFEGATDWLNADKLRMRSEELDAALHYQQSTDLHPSIYLQRLAHWELLSSNSRILAKMRDTQLGTVIGGLIIIGACTLALPLLRHRDALSVIGGTLSLSVGSTGFTTMAASIIWLFGFQSLYGYVYQRIGWIIALFMGGLVVGCLLASVPPARQHEYPDTEWRRLIGIDFLLAILSVLTPTALGYLGNHQSSDAELLLVETTISVLVAANGLLGGAAFALAGRIQLAVSRKVGQSVGAVVSADHAGACLGALLCGVLLVPSFGIGTTAYLLAGLKITSAGLLAIGKRLHNQAVIT